MHELTPAILKTKKHFEILDGLRGIAALAVVSFHFMEMVCPDYSKIFTGHSFLAVDFFFCLSGFVISYAYDDRIGKLGIANFFKARLIRLHPLIISGSVLGLLAFLFDPFVNQAKLYSAGETILIFISSLFLIPFTVVGQRGHALFALNAPAWSLFWEYIANIFYALILCRINRRYLMLLTIISSAAIGLVLYKSGSLTGGWNLETFWDGGARIAYSFLAGILIFRSNWIIKNRLGFAGIAILLFLAFIVPFSKWNWVTEPIVVLFYFPLIVILGAGATLTNGLKKLCVFLGKISYPLYMTHYAVIWIFGHFNQTYKPGTTQLCFIIITGVILLLGLSYLIMTYFDIPLRRYLNSKRKN